MYNYIYICIIIYINHVQTIYKPIDSPLDPKGKPMNIFVRNAQAALVNVLIIVGKATAIALMYLMYSS